ncbi:hypothetical protein MWU75_13995 [Ornithinimicrobium sp. F0845]|uniref:hypothetical protein n=1 Tax=Ornithinimicrobium sp. F0845 TaxID=2926412 RepID=UPI001FF4C050|nr:hypothetical protein [Ornithinimicrobium sp. F0845]MCK0113256.1 hypothetical protein [Ornithinimicrobium sp. F0845]
MNSSQPSRRLARLGAVLASVALMTSASIGVSTAQEAPDPPFWIEMPPVAGPTEVAPNRTVLVARINIPPGGYVDWHRHPGMTSVTVEGDGTFTLMSTNCTATDYTAGDSFNPPLSWHTARNVSDLHVVGVATFVFRGNKPTIMAKSRLDANLDRRCGLAE